MSEKMQRPEKRKHPVIDSIRTFQTISGHLSNAIAPDENPMHVMEHIEDEMTEAREAILSGDRKKVASELPDIVILAFRVADFYGIDMAEAITAKLHRNSTKYWGPVKNAIEEGQDPQEARNQAKKDWDRSRDHEYEVD